MHTANEIRNIFEDDKAVDDNSVKQLETGLYLLDPYYRNGIADLTEEEFNKIFPATDSKIYNPEKDTYKNIDHSNLQKAISVINMYIRDVTECLNDYSNTTVQCIKDLEHFLVAAKPVK